MSKSTLPAVKMNAVSEEQEQPTADLDVPEEVQFAERYKYPAVKKSVFKNIGCYKYQPRSYDLIYAIYYSLHWV